MSSIGKNLKRLREASGMTQLDLAKRLDYTKQTISNYETGRREPDIETVGKIAGALNVSIESIIADEDENKPDIFSGSSGVPEPFSQKITEMIESEIQARVEEKIKETGLDDQPKGRKWRMISAGMLSMSDDEMDRIYNFLHALHPEKFPPLDDETKG